MVSSGTGGHLTPVLAVARGLAARGHETLLVIEGRPAEHALLSEGQVVKARSLGLGGSGAGLVVRIARATFAARRLLRSEGVRLVIGTGGRTILPVALAARSLGIDLVLMEQNAVPGRANRLLARWARRVYVGLPGPLQWPHAVFTGTPLRPEIFERDRAAARAALGLRPDVAAVMVTGGSQGAETLNRVVPEALCSLHRPLEVLHACGAGRSAAVRLRYAPGVRYGVAALVRDTVTDMATWYAAADLVVCRGGGATVAELMAAGRAAVIVPYPHHRDRQQYHNGRVLERHGAAVVLPQGELTGPRLAATVKQLLGGGICREMGERARALARRDSCQRILEDVCGLLDRL